jgi:hypothetical protein
MDSTVYNDDSGSLGELSRLLMINNGKATPQERQKSQGWARFFTKVKKRLTNEPKFAKLCFSLVLFLITGLILTVSSNDRIESRELVGCITSIKFNIH